MTGPQGGADRRERPIIFSGPMVRALLDGRKTQTRRVVKPQPPACGPPEYEKYCALHGALRQQPPYGAPGDRLWVRETWQQVIRRRVTSEEAWWPGRQEWPGVGSRSHSPSKFNGEHHVIIYRADGEMPGGFPERWRSPIHMPRWASRITLEVTDIRVERLQDITQEDAIAEGVERAGATSGAWMNYSPDGPSCEGPRESFRSLWWSINGADSWSANPWVWVLTFNSLQSIHRGFGKENAS